MFIPTIYRDRSAAGRKGVLAKWQPVHQEIAILSFLRACCRVLKLLKSYITSPGLLEEVLDKAFLHSSYSYSSVLLIPSHKIESFEGLKKNTNAAWNF